MEFGFVVRIVFRVYLHLLYTISRSIHFDILQIFFSLPLGKEMV
jgi:hypothetical protein